MVNSIGLIESKGLVALIEVADVILKNSPVNILGIHKLENGLISLAVSGNSDYVKAAVDAGVEAGKRVGEIHSFSVIDNPQKELINLFGDLFPEAKLKEINKIDVKTETALEPEKHKLEEISKEIISVNPVVRSESKREKSKPILVTNVDPIKIVKKTVDKKSEKIKPVDSEKETKKNIDEKLIQQKDEEDETKKSISTIERLRLEALGLKKKDRTNDNVKSDSEIPNEKVNKINLALESRDIDFSAIDEMNVHKLRNYARKFPEFPIKGREISRANRDELVKLFKSLII